MKLPPYDSWVRLLVAPVWLLCAAGCNSRGPLTPSAKGGSVVKTDNPDDRTGDFIATAELGDGRLVAVFFNETHGGLEVAVETKPGSRNFTSRVIKSKEGIIGLYNGIAARGDTIHIITLDDTNGRPVYLTGTPEKLSDPEVIDPVAGGKRRAGLWGSIALDAQGLPYVSYYDETLAMLFYAHRRDGQWHPQPVAAASTETGGWLTGYDYGRYSKIRIAADGTRYIGFYVANLGDVYLAIAAGADDPPRWQFQLVDDKGDVGQWLDLALDGSGQPVLAYYDGTRGDLKLARPLSGIGPQVVDGRKSNVGLDPSLKLDATGLAHIAYLDADGFNLKQARENAENFEHQTLDEEGIVGFFPSLTLRGEQPTVLYHLVHKKNAEHKSALEQKVLVFPPL